MIELKEIPFFVVGSPRSGTTLLRFMLSSHPRLYIPEETGFLPALNQSPAAQLNLSQVAALLDRIGRLNRYWDQMITDLDSFYAGLPEPRMEHILDCLYHQKMAEYGGARWGDKTPGYVRYIPEVSRIFPSAQFIHLIRDGRDATLSAQKKWGQDRWYMDQYYLLKNWVVNVEAGRGAGRNLGKSRYLEIRYEELVTNPDEVLLEVCDFLGEELVSEMRDPARMARHHAGPDVPSEVQRPVSIESVARWRRQMTDFELKISDRLAGPLLTQLGYETGSLGTFTFPEVLQFSYQRVKFLLVDRLRRLLYTVGLVTLNRGRRRRRVSTHRALKHF